MAEPKKEIGEISLSPVSEKPDAPKNETARISVLPRPAQTDQATQPAPVIITSVPAAPLDSIPPPLCWAVFGISAVIFLIQIWNYVVS